MGYNHVPGVLNYEIGNTGIHANDFIDVINANGGQNNNLGLFQPGGITRGHLLNAAGRANGGVANTLRSMANQFGKFDVNGNGKIEQGDIRGFVNQNIRWYHPFSRGTARSHMSSVMRAEFGIR